MLVIYDTDHFIKNMSMCIHTHTWQFAKFDSGVKFGSSLVISTENLTDFSYNVVTQTHTHTPTSSPTHVYASGGIFR